MSWARKEAARIRAASARTQPLFLILDFNNPEHPNDGHTWHRTGARLDELARQARYAPDTLTKEDIQALAGIASSYRALVSKPGPIRDAVCARMREFDDGEGGARYHPFVLPEKVQT